MANIEKIEIRIKREETKLESYLQRKQELETQIRDTKKKIEDLEAIVKYQRMSHANNVASDYGITPEDYELAMITGDFSIIQEKRQKALAAKATPESSASSASETSESTGDSYGEEERPE